jgi:hypothetical protein
LGQSERKVESILRSHRGIREREAKDFNPVNSSGVLRPSGNYMNHLL